MSERITVQLPLEGLLFWKLDGVEALSHPFELTVTLLSADPRIERHALLGQPLTVSVPTGQLLSGTRHINGKITRMAVRSEELGGTRYAVYELTIEPDLWPMRRDKNSRIFQGQTAVQIIHRLLAEYGVQVEDRLSGSYREWEYCVQYQESSFAFISRLMELEGIYYWFRHEADRHVMVLSDAPEAHGPWPGCEAIPYHVTGSGGVTSAAGVSRWALEDSVTPGMYSIDDYDFRKPNAWLLQARQNPASPQPGQTEVFEWPGRYVEHAQGEKYVRVRQEEWQAAHRQISGEGTALCLAPGYTFALLNAPHLQDNGRYLTLRAEYQLEENRYASGEGQTVHRIRFRVLPAEVAYRAAATTPWPKTHGPQTARVVGPQGESIYTDRYGRIKVKFHWDRESRGDETSSCWVRVSSAWAGQGYGGVQIPRVNDEVVIDFINGDPDRPIVTGRVYNEGSMPPWSLPGAATQMGFLSRSKDGTPDNANALRFEDRAGEEQVWIQAERNLDVNVKNDATRHIGSNHSHYVRKNELHRVEANQVQAVKGGTEILTGQGKLDATVEQYVLASGSQLRLVCGNSAIELNANGQINLVGKGFNLFVEGDGNITTSGGKLNLNTAGAKPGTTAPGPDHKQDIKQAVEAKFTPGKEGKHARPNTASVFKVDQPAATTVAPSFTEINEYHNDPNDSNIMPFSEGVIKKINQSPTLQRDMNQLKKDGWAIQPGQVGEGSSTDQKYKLIIMDPEHYADDNEAVNTLAHEAGHALYPVTPDYSSRRKFVDSQLLDEGGATLNNIQVQREILTNTGEDIGIAASPENMQAYNRAYDKMTNGELSRKKAAEAIGRIYGKGEVASGTDQVYEDYYGSFYDEIH